MADLAARLQDIVDAVRETSRRFSYPRVMMFIFEGSAIGAIGWLLIIAGLAYPPLGSLGQVAAFVGFATVALGTITYVILWVNSSLNRRLS